MQAIKFIYWQDDDFWLGYIQDYPDYMTQGETLEELKENLRDLYRDFTGGEIPGIRKVDDLVLS
ncbi:MAG: type II toxin-antitoxin system HicB family antitoxin [Gemmatimonadetes bacterium]|nr:type II toxin-antitoxin system HicB family antitoxin [Gemmatimonadota bacterium]